MTNILKKGFDYAYVGIVPMINTCVSAAAMTYGTHMDSPITYLLGGAYAVHNLAVSAMKFNRFNRMKKDFERFGWDERMARPLTITWCDRHLSKHAARRAGHLSEYDAFLEKYGYTWKDLMVSPTELKREGLALKLIPIPLQE